MNNLDLQKRYNTSRYNLLLLIILSVINIATILFNGTYFLFSLSFPRFLMWSIMLLVDEGQITAEEINYVRIGIFMILSLVPFIISYVLSSKNRYKAFYVALAFFIIDSIITLLMFDLIDIGFHIYILVLIIMGILNGKKLAQYFPEENEDINLEVTQSETNFEDSPILRSDAPKGKILLSVNKNGLNIVVKRRYKLTELIIDGNVYDEYKGLVEMQYQLEAIVNNNLVHFILQGSRMYIFINNKQVTEKLRLF